MAVLVAVPTLSVAAARPAAAATSPAAATAPHAVRSHALSAGYDTVGSDGGVFVFGSPTGLYGSLPGLGIHVKNIVGIVATADGGGYYLVGNDGGVFAFGDAPYIQSLPGTGVHVSGIVAKPDLTGYWLIGKTSGISNFGSATAFTGNACTSGCVPLAGGASTSTGEGLWTTDVDGDVGIFGDATFYGGFDASPFGGTTIPGGPTDIVSIVSPFDGGGYFLVGADGGIFSFGNAPFYGSLPQIGVHVSNIVGAVPTATS